MEVVDSFASALHGAILARGLTLNRLSQRLAERGFALSTATLSYWSRGKYRPEGPESLAALAALEEILQVPAGSLRGLLSTRARQRRAKSGQLVPFRELWGDFGAKVDQVIAQVGLSSAQHRVLSLHERHQFDGRGAERLCRVIMVIEAATDEVDRIVAVFREDQGRSVGPTVRPVSGIRLGRVLKDTATHVLFAELWFDRALRRGERTAIEYELRYGIGGDRSTMCERSFPARIKQYVVEVAFAPTAVPRRCRLVTEPIDGTPPATRPASVGIADTVRMVLLDQRAGSYRIEWEWE